MDLKGTKAIDLFSGAGGFSLAAHNLGVNILAAVEYDSNACETYRINLVEERNQNTHIINKDILQISPLDLLSSLALDKGELDILIGGPPCQGFSSHRINDAGIDDPRNKLLLRYFDFVKVLQPKVFLIENVPGLLWKRHELYLQKLKNLSKRNSYKILGPIKINAKDFGVPQNRNRVFILGVRSDINTKAISWPPKPSHYASGKGSPEWVNASVAFASPPQLVIDSLIEKIGPELGNSLKYGTATLEATDDSSSIHMSHTKDLVDRFSKTPINGGRTDLAFRLPCHSGDYVGHKDVYGRIRLGQPGPTITSGCFNPSKGRFLHPWKNHGITIRHAARLQTFPDSFIFSGGITSQGTQVGNAVPVLLGEVMIKEALKCVFHMCDSKIKSVC
jgi:DNA (cytosine-5)-methyltransferase 1